eukprot:GILJ01026917.1.p1 GENE.GILJ01026917.1~~GILJ01026917.1.p1  ORF type:complete len:209 (-),score=25.32 GILJ01026917.1:46-630(-)
MEESFNSNKSRVPYGEVQGMVDGVPAYSNGRDSYFSRVRNVNEEKIPTGYKWQCVEFARRWLMAKRGLYLPDVKTAALVFDMQKVHCMSTSEARPMVAVANGGARKPEKDSFIIWPATNAAPFGHIGVIVEVTDTYIRVADQNQFFHQWQGNYSHELRLVYHAKSDTWTIKDYLRGKGWNPLGWMTFPAVHIID